MEQNKKSDPLFLIYYRDPREGKETALKARKVYDSPLGLSFICISDFVFETNSLLIKPAEEQLKKRLEDVKSLHLSIHSIISIEEIGENHKGLHFKKDKSNLIVLPKDTPLN